MKKYIWLVLFLALNGSVFATATSQQYLDAGNQFYRAKDMNKAIQYFKAAIQVDPNNAAAHQSLGSAYYSMGQKSEALAEYQRSLAINPNNPQLSSFVQTLQSQGVAPSAGSPASGGSSSSSGNKIMLAPMAGLGYCTSTGYGIGFGGGLSAYFPGGSGLFFGGSAAYYSFAGPTLTNPGVETLTDSFTNIEVVGLVKFFVGTGDMKPYLVGGAGLSNFSETIVDTITGSGTTTYSGSTMNPMVVAGGGWEFAAGKDMSFFVESRASIIIGSGGTVSYVPFTGGVAFGL